MGSLLILFTTVVLFCFACNGLIRSISTAPDLSRLNSFNYKALKIERGYKVFSWIMLTLFFFVSLVIICIDSFNSF